MIACVEKLKSVESQFPCGCFHQKLRINDEFDEAYDQHFHKKYPVDLHDTFQNQPVFLGLTVSQMD